MNSPQPLNPKGTWRTYTTAEGLAGMQTEYLIEDTEDYLWIGTINSGVSRFEVASEVGKGTAFMVKLPLGKG